MSLFSSSDRDWTEMARYLSGELSPEEQAGFEGRMTRDPEASAHLQEVREVWDATAFKENGWDAPNALGRIHQRAATAPVLRFVPKGPEPLIRFGVAASIALVSLALGWWLTRTARQNEARLAEQADAPMAELATTPGQRADLLLPDGSRVTLGMASRLRYPTRYAGHSRDLYLDGEAYFQVVPDSDKPFRVHTRLGVTQDLATAFNVRAYSGGPVSVVVAEGAVVLRPTESDSATPPDSLVLEAADLGRVGADGKLTFKRDVDVESYTAWRRDRLVFRKTPLAEVLEALRAWDGIEVELGDSSVADSTLTATFDKGESSRRVLDVMRVALKLRYEQRGALTLVFRR